MLQDNNLHTTLSGFLYRLVLWDELCFYRACHVYINTNPRLPVQRTTLELEQPADGSWFPPGGQPGFLPP